MIMSVHWTPGKKEVSRAWSLGRSRSINRSHASISRMHGRGTDCRRSSPTQKSIERYGLIPPNPDATDPKKEKQLKDLVANAAGRGWEILFFGPGHTGRAKSPEQDPFGALSLAAGIEDTMRAYPQATGVLIDGGGEHHYELAFHHGGELLEIRDSEKPVIQHLGMDMERMESGDCSPAR